MACPAGPAGTSPPRRVRIRPSPTPIDVPCQSAPASVLVGSSRRSSVAPSRRNDPSMLPRARSSIVLTALAILAACGKEGPIEPAGGVFTLGQSLAVESGRDARVLGGSSGGTFVAVVVNLSFDSVGQTSDNLRASGIKAGDRGPSPARGG